MVLRVALRDVAAANALDDSLGVHLAELDAESSKPLVRVLGAHDLVHRGRDNDVTLPHGAELRRVRENGGLLVAVFGDEGEERVDVGERASRD